MLQNITLANADKTASIVLNGKLRKFTGCDQPTATDWAAELKTGEGKAFAASDIRQPHTLEDLRDALTAEPVNALVVEEITDTKHSVDLDALDAIAADPAPAPAAAPATGDDAALAAIIKRMAGGGAVDAEQVRTIVQAEVAYLKSLEDDKVPHKVVTLEYHAPAGVEKVDMAHPALAEVLTWVNAGCHPLLVGPAGSGKTTIGMHVAKALGREFYFTGAVDNVFKLNGYRDANGNYVRTSFRDAYENGGVFLFDEIDASHPQAIVAFNAALANGHHDFPDGSVERHPDFVCLAAANTYGRGADRVYAGRNQLDGASLDRFVSVPVDYDTGLEFKLGEGNPGWVEYVHNVRRAVEKTATKHVVGTRAIINGCKGLAAGLSRSRVEDATIWKGLSPDIIRKVKAEM